MVNQITYYQQKNDIACIVYKNSTLSYPVHTHAKHITFGYLTDGELRVICGARECLYHAGESFCIMPDILHTVEALNGVTYSMISVCIPMDKIVSSKDEQNYSNTLKKMIINVPENRFSIEDMAQNIGVSPYHMIRQFKNVCGLTPHQFQIQCRVRKAQKLLEEGESVTEAAYATGFCDQSHLDRCFRKIVRLTPSAYQQAVKKLV